MRTNPLKNVPTGPDTPYKTVKLQEVYIPRRLMAAVLNYNIADDLADLCR